MLMYGLDRPDILSIQFSGKGIIYNLTSLKEGFIPLNLIPPNSIGRFVDRDFDIMYANYIMCNDAVFCEFFQIIYNLYTGNDIFIIYSNNDWCENIIESLLKLIQQRYGYNAVRIDSDEDYIYARNNMTFAFASGYGIYNLDQDKERFSYLVESFRLHNGRIPYNIEFDYSNNNGARYGN